MKINWAKKGFEEIGNIGRGKSRHRPRNDSVLYGGKYPFIQTGDIQSADFKITQFTQTYSDFGLAQSKLWPTGTLCISIVGANTAESAILGFDSCFPDSVIGFNAYEGELDNYFLKYYLELLKVQLKNISEGAARENLSLEKLLTFKIPWPPASERRKITRILSAYDDLIENNLKRIKLLEEMAQITYEEWFVRLKFPGHETTPLDSATGLPVGWNEAEITVISFINANSIKAKDAPETIKYIDIASVDTGFYQIPQIMSYAEAPSRARRKVNFGDTIFSTVRPNRKTYSLILEDDPMLVASTGFAVLTPKIEETFPFVYLTVANQSFVDKAVAVAGGAAYPAINQNDFEKIKIIKPADTLIKLFSDKVLNNFIAKNTLAKQNQLLKEARDILLPRLMTGMIDVEQLVLPEPFSNPSASTQEPQAV
ncbi:hypothetical protein A1359_07875 [Methylomonas lenta]|uniref:Type I restriction modification DNA specificity domain-containing protein n=1 Tax=Methylomonas lenta TaxID=980561 RepID=A0A177NER9_9GAMM|nr:restriction endonuclease subunit S [Methylomonas lenta]OAI16556.1 hypothetical protein A1359_07875 [Methylomonas lenta]